MLDYEGARTKQAREYSAVSNRTVGKLGYGQRKVNKLRRLAISCVRTRLEEPHWA